MLMKMAKNILLKSSLDIHIFLETKVKSKNWQIYRFEPKLDLQKWPSEPIFFGDNYETVSPNFLSKYPIQYK
jgi:hypothetical protein